MIKPLPDHAQYKDLTDKINELIAFANETNQKLNQRAGHAPAERRWEQQGKDAKK